VNESGELSEALLRDLLLLVQPARHAPAQRELARRVRAELLAIRVVRDDDVRPVKLTCAQAAAFLGVTVKTLEDWRGKWRQGLRIGPPFFEPKGVRPYYLLSDLIWWREASRAKVPPTPARSRQ
jgi:hypothetical protein